MNDTFIIHVFINLSKRTITVLDTDGNDRLMDFPHNLEGAQDFTAACSEIADIVDTEMITYTFAEQ
tara:strand:- start:966 stop:1163 length:198 start_codon:yes stop_codon:yes gene_type:complete